MHENELRYEYRIFLKNADFIKYKIRKSFDHIDIKKSFELYLVFKNSHNFNVKFRNNKLSIKKLTDTQEGFQKWEPLSQDKAYQTIQLLFENQDVTLSDLHQDTIIKQAKRSKNILAVPLSKKRSLFKCDLLLEIAQVKIANSSFHTVCIESSDLYLLKERAKDLGILEYKNCDYVQKILQLC